MGLLKRFSWARDVLAAGVSEAPSATFSVDIPTGLFSPEILLPGLTAVSREKALTVGSVMTARNRIAGLLALCPLQLVGPTRERLSSDLFDQPEKGRAASVTLAHTFEDLLFDGVAWWIVRERDWRGYPRKVERLDGWRVTQDVHTGRVYVDGQPVADSDIIQFESPRPGLLKTAGPAIAQCIMLSEAAGRYTSEPLPTGYFTPSGDVEPDEDDVEAALSAWSTSRRERSTGFVPGGLDYKTVQWSPEQLQLADARQHAALEIARHTGISPEKLGIAVTSRSYANIEQESQQEVTSALQPLGQALAERLSLADITPRGYRARIEYGGLLRSDTASRYTAYQAGLAVGALTQAEIREREDLPAVDAPPTKESIDE